MQCVLRHLRASGVCATASSEEDPVRIDLSDSLAPNVGRELEYAVGFDPLDGSSIIDANFSVGSVCKRTSTAHAVADSDRARGSAVGPAAHCGSRSS